MSAKKKNSLLELNCRNEHVWKTPKTWEQNVAKPCLSVLAAAGIQNSFVCLLISSFLVVKSRNSGVLL